MVRRLVCIASVMFALLGAGSCASIDLSRAVAVTDVLTGWYDWGIKDGLNKLVPSITFKLTNTGTRPLDGVQVTAAFWIDGADGPNDDKQVQAISTEAIAPGAATEAITIRSDFGYTYEGARADMFTNSSFKDVTARLFAKRGGKIVRIGEFKLDRRLLPHAAQAPGRP
jgi:hypothetical protein